LRGVVDEDAVGIRAYEGLVLGMIDPEVLDHLESYYEGGDMEIEEEYYNDSVEYLFYLAVVEGGSVSRTYYDSNQDFHDEIFTGEYFFHVWLAIANCVIFGFEPAASA
jgi:hypothetical protein